MNVGGISTEKPLKFKFTPEGQAKLKGGGEVEKAKPVEKLVWVRPGTLEFETTAAVCVCLFVPACSSVSHQCRLRAPQASSEFDIDLDLDEDTLKGLFARQSEHGGGQKSKAKAAKKKEGILDSKRLHLVSITLRSAKLDNGLVLDALVSLQLVGLPPGALEVGGSASPLPGAAVFAVA